MIARIKGILIHKSPEYLVVDVQGIGYRVFIPLSTFYGLPEVHQEVQLHIHTIVKQDLLNLYGFLTEEEREAFQLLIAIAGIGPKLANNILSGISVRELKEAVADGDIAKIRAIPGVGKRTAERISLELKEKLRLFEEKKEGLQRGIPSEGRTEEDVLLALVNLGYKKKVAERAVARVLESVSRPPNLETLLKESLKILANP